MANKKTNGTKTIIETNNGRWQGSTKTAMLVADQIAERWGEKEAKNYEPSKNCLTYKRWQDKGYQVQKGEKALKSYTYLLKKEIDEETGKILKRQRYPRSVYLFYIKQVKPIEAEK